MLKKEKIFSDRIAPLLDQIHEICKKSGITAITAFQLGITPEEGVKVHVSGSRATDAVQQFDVAMQVLSGKVSVMAVPVEQAMSLGLTKGVTELIKQHADECDDCKQRLTQFEASGKPFTMADFSHPEAEKLPEEVVEIQALTDEENISLKSSVMFGELLKQNGFKH